MKLSDYLSEKIKILSFLLTILIVILHASMANLSTGGIRFLQEVMTAEVTRIAVPLFYLTSGFLFFINYQNTWGDYRRKLSARTRSVLIPYILFLLCGSLGMFFLGHIYTIDTFWKIIKHGIFFSPPIFYPLWFLRDLYVMVLIAPIVYWVIKKVPILLIVPIVVWLLGKNPFAFPMTEAMLFFSVGAFLSTKVKWLEQTEHRASWGCIILWLLLCFMNRYVSEYVISFPYATHCVILLLGIYAVWILYDKLYPKFSERVKSAKIYKFSFFIYLFHEPILTILKKTGLFVLGYSSWSIGIIYVFAPILTIFVVYGIGLVLNTYCPQVLAFITGGRTRRN